MSLRSSRRLLRSDSGRSLRGALPALVLRTQSKAFATSPDLGSDDDAARCTRVRVKRQQYIATTKDELHEALKHSHSQLRPGTWREMGQVLRAVELIHGLEFHIAGEDLQKVLAALNNCVVVPKGASVNRGACGEPEDAVYASPKTAVNLQQEFLSKFKALSDKSNFRQVSARDSAMAEALNADYLSQLFIKPSPEATEGTLVESLVNKDMDPSMQTVAVFKRGWGEQRREGVLLGRKIDFLQQVAARNFLRYLQRQADRMDAATQKLWDRLQGAAQQAAGAMQARARVEYARLLGLKPPGEAAACEQQAEASLGSPGHVAPHAQPKQLETINPPPSAPAPVAAGNMSAFAMRQSSSPWRWSHGGIDEEDRLRKFEDMWPVREDSRLLPMHISRTTVGDALGSDRLTALRGQSGSLALLAKLQLKEPTFREVMCLSRTKAAVGFVERWSKALLDWRHAYRKARWDAHSWIIKAAPRALRKFLPSAGPEPVPRQEPPFLMRPVNIRVYKNIPVPIWRVCFPYRKVAFKPLDMIKMDLLAMAGVSAILAQVLNGNQGNALQLVWISSIGMQAMRVILGYTRMYAHFEGYVHRTLHDQQVASEDGIGALLGAYAAAQQYKQTAILYTLLVSRLRPRPQAFAVQSDTVVVLPDQLAGEAEALLSSCGEQVLFDIEEPLNDLVRLGMARVVHRTNPDSALRRQFRIQILAPPASLRALEERWRNLLSNHAATSSRVGDASAKATSVPPWRFSYSYWENSMTSSGSRDHSMPSGS